MSLSTHILDAALGRPAQGVEVNLEHWSGDTWSPIASGVTDPDGRIRFTGATGAELALEAATYRLGFATGSYFSATGQTGFYPRVLITFEVTQPDTHHHVPLLLSPFAYSTYRGS